MTTIINLYGGPGTGKSTSAAYLFHALKVRGVNCELVREAAKDWAWEKREIDRHSQLYLMGRQIRRESMLLGAVDVIITDAPVFLFGYYGVKFSPPAMGQAILDLSLEYMRDLEVSGHSLKHVFLTREKEYNPAGRYQTEAEAKAIDVEVAAALTNAGLPYTVCGTDTYSLGRLIYGL